MLFLPQKSSDRSEGSRSHSLSRLKCFNRVETNVVWTGKHCLGQAGARGPRPGMWAEGTDVTSWPILRGNDAEPLEAETLTLFFGRFESFFSCRCCGATAPKPLDYRRPEATSFPLPLWTRHNRGLPARYQRTVLTKLEPRNSLPKTIIASTLCACPAGQKNAATISRSGYQTAPSP